MEYMNSKAATSVKKIAPTQENVPDFIFAEYT